MVPTSLIPVFLQKAHGDLHSGHPGEKRTFDKISKFCFWPGMRKDVYDRVRTCSFCQAVRPQGPKNMVPVKAQKASFPLEYVQADLVKFHPPSHGFDHVLVIEDRFTKYTCFYPISGKSTVTVAKKLSDFVTRFGAPVTFGSDNGGEFRSRLIEALCMVYGTKKTFSLAYHPQSQGQTERKNRTLIAELSKRVAQYGSDWASHLPWIAFSYNTTPHTSTKIAPHTLMFGREARSPLQSQLPEVDLVGWDGTAKNYFRQHQKQMVASHKLAREYHQKYRQTMEAQSTRNKVAPSFEEGDFVWARIPTEDRHKLSLHFDGPWLIKKTLGNTAILEKDNKTAHRPHCDLKPYEPPKFEPLPPVSETEKGSNDSTVTDLSHQLNRWLSFAHVLNVPAENNLSHFIPAVTLATPEPSAGGHTDTLLGTSQASSAQDNIMLQTRYEVSDDVEVNDDGLGVIEPNQGIIQDESIPLFPPPVPPPSPPPLPPPPPPPPIPPSSSTRLTRELRRLRDHNSAGLNQTSLTELPAKRRRL